MSGAQEPLEHFAAGVTSDGSGTRPRRDPSRFAFRPRYERATTAISLSLLGKCQYSAIGRSLFAAQPSMGAELVVMGWFVVPEMDPTAARRRRTRAG